MSKQFSFGSVPTIKARRTKFDMSYNVKTSMNVGTLYPIYLQEVVPGDTFKCNSSIVSRVTSSYLKPVMDNIYQDIYFFFVPSRICYDRWAEIFGENPRSAWANTEDVKVPRIGNYQVNSGGVADYLGLPIATIEDEEILTTESRFGVQAIPFRAFAKIWNDWFRDENNVDPVNVLTGETTSVETLNNSPWSATNYTGKLPKVAKFHDYFTSCLPSPQKGGAVELSLGSGFVPLRTTDSLSLLTSDDVDRPLKVGFGTYTPFSQEWTPYNLSRSDLLGTDLSGQLSLFYTTDSSGNSLPSYPRGESLQGTVYPAEIIETNLGINSSDLQAVSVNDLRYAFQLQKLLEKDARGGTRYVEYILSHFGVTSPDARLQNPEFLGGKRIPLNVQQVAQTNTPANASLDDSLGSLSAYSLTNGNAGFSKGFTEHGFIIGVSCLRYKHSYQQGVEKFWTRNKRTDFYDPVFANIGEQPVYKTELFFGESMTASIDEPLGYNEAWADMRFRRNIITGQMRSNVENSLDVWHFADNYTSSPTLSQDFIEETPIYVNRTLAVDSDVQDQFIVDIYHNVEAIREMPLYSIPGLIDHH